MSTNRRDFAGHQQSKGRTRAGPRRSDRHRRSPLAPVAPHQPRPARVLHTRWSAEAWSQVRVEFKRALALRSEIRRAGWFN